MFDFVQKHRRLLQIFLGLIALTFATWGIESYTRFAGGRDAVATVNGGEISTREFGEKLRQQQEQMRRLFGSQIDPAALDTPDMRRAVLDQIIAERLVAYQAAKANLFMSREAVIEAITTAPEFQENGKFSAALYSAYLTQRGTTDKQNVADLQSQLPLSRLVGAIADTAIASRTVADRLAAIEGQKREVSDAKVALQPFLAQVKVDEAKARAYYEANSAEFRIPERVRAEYVVLSADNLAKQEQPTDAEIREAYQARSAAFKVEEQRRASHILVKTREEADKLLAEAKKNPKRFGELAKAHSTDAGSAGNGGDLGWFDQGSMIKAFADAVFSMKQGEIREVQSSEGWHVVLLTGIQGGKVRPLEEVRKQLAADLAKQKAARKYADSAEAFSNMVYEQSESLKPAAEKFGLQIQTTDWISRSGKPPAGPLDNPKLLAALFSSDALLNKRNTDAIEVAPSTLVAARVVEHQPAAQRKFEEVRADIEQQLRRREAFELARKDGEAKLEQLRKGEAAVPWGPAKMVSRGETQGYPPEVMRAVVAADVSKLPAYVGMPVPDAGYLLLRISKVVPGEPPKDERQNAQRVAQMIGAAQFEAYVASLKGKADISINSGNLEQK